MFHINKKCSTFTKDKLPATARSTPKLNECVPVDFRIRRNLHKHFLPKQQEQDSKQTDYDSAKIT